MEWLDWSDQAFARARERGVPVLLFVRAAWCRWCRELEDHVLSHPDVARRLSERFVTIRVDKDRRPDIDARYSKGGWPTLAWLDDMGELLVSDTYIEVEPLLSRLELVADYYAKNRDTIRARIAELERERRAQESGLVQRSQPESGLPQRGQPEGGLAHRSQPEGGLPQRSSPEGGLPQRTAAKEPTLSLGVVDHVARTVLENSDPVYGGWGRDQKFPHSEAIDFALIRWSQTGDNAMLQLVRRTLRHMQEGEIHDAVEGGFYRYTTQVDWSVPNHEKMLDSNAQRLSAYLEAWQALGEDSFKETAQGILRWMKGSLLDPETRAFKGSQDADPAHAHLGTIEARREFGAPACDPTIFTNWNAMAVSALLKASIVLREPKHREQALATLEFLLDEMFDSERGMYHYWDGTYHLPGLLSDQAYMVRALIDAMQYAGENRYLAPARKLADLAIENLKSPGGGFYDTLYDPTARGGLRRRNRSILENSVMAEAFLRLALLTRDNDYADTARETLASFLPDYKRYGHFVASYARAVDLLFHEPVHVTVLGSRGSVATQLLQEAALRPYLASRIVQIIDPAEDAEIFTRSGLPLPESPHAVRAYVQRGRGSYAETSDPVRLPALMTRVERGD